MQYIVPNIMTQQKVHPDSEDFDLCIIGGGASGAGCALDAALRGLKVVLIEADDFAAGTSSHSTKLIHGGVRYLEQAFMQLDFAQLRQVRHGLHERHILLKNAPHLARPLALITPVRTWVEGLYYTIGLKVYSWFAARKDTLPASDWLTKAQTLATIPTLNPKLHSAIKYYDGQFDDARFALALALSAAKAGATVINHTRAIEFRHDLDGKVTSLNVVNQISGEKSIIKATLFLNCTGPHADTIRQLANPNLLPRIRPSKGVHITLPRSIMPSDAALLIPKTRDGRLIFAIPFGGKVILGTTDDDCTDLAAEPRVNADEVAYLLETLQPYLAVPIEAQMVEAGFGGLRPLIIAAEKQTKALLRDHEVAYDPQSNLFSLLGGKWTTYRLMAHDAIDQICQKCQHDAPCTTENHILIGGHQTPKQLHQTIKNTNLPDDILAHLIQNYGDQIHVILQIIAKDNVLRQRILPEWPFIEAEVIYTVRHEMAKTVRDFLARRIRLEILDWQAAAKATPIVANLMTLEIGWSDAHRNQETEKYLELLASLQRQIK